MDAQLGFDTLTPISSIHHRLAAWKARARCMAWRCTPALALTWLGCAQSLTGKEIPLFVGDVWCATPWQRRTPVRFRTMIAWL
jgi:hypothetical protein